MTVVISCPATPSGFGDHGILQMCISDADLARSPEIVAQVVVSLLVDPSNFSASCRQVLNT